MSVSEPIWRDSHYALRARNGGSYSQRLTILCALILSDLACFIIADMLLRLFSQPPALELFHGHPLNQPDNVIDVVMLIALFFVLVRYLFGDYSRRQLFWDGAQSTTKALLVSGCIYTALVLLLEPSGTTASVCVWTGLLFVLPTARQLMRLLLAKIGLWHLPTAIIGTSKLAQEVLQALGTQLALGLKVQWVVPEIWAEAIPDALSGLTPLAMSHEELALALVAVGCRQVILVRDDLSDANPNDLIDQLVGADISVLIVPSLRRLPLYGLSTSYFFGKDLLLLQVRNNLARLPQRIFKRALDLIGAVILAVILFPICLIFALLIYREDRGPVFFRQSRVGRNGRDFICWKFRTMVIDAEDQLVRWEGENPILFERYRKFNFKLAADPRITRVGAWMRRKSLDELPQLINVVLGDMSLVGPRPLLRRELPDYGAVINLYERVRPGITGLWQISGRSHTTFAERVSYDEWYIKNWTVWYDVVILLRTAYMLLKGNDGAY